MTASRSQAGPALETDQATRTESRLRAMIRTIRREVRDYPATAVFSASWVAVFAAMVWLQWRSYPPPSWWRLLVLGIGDGHRFGDLTLAELGRGEVWRLITCTFVHYSLVHITLNLLAFYLLGTLVESWYGSAQFILIYGITGGGGNLVSAIIRQVLGSNPNVHAGGGSVVVMGLIGLCAVVGWRSRTKRGSDLGWQMSKALAMTGLLGIAFPRYIDNWGHAGGAIVGFSLGLFHRLFLRRYSDPRSWVGGVIMSLVILGSAAAQYRADRAERPLREQLARRFELELYELALRDLRTAMAVLDRGRDPKGLATELSRVGPVLDRGDTRADFRRLDELARQAARRPLGEMERQDFMSRADRLAAGVRKELEVRFREYRRERSKTPAPAAQRRPPTGPLVRRAPSR